MKNNLKFLALSSLFFTPLFSLASCNNGPTKPKINYSFVSTLQYSSIEVGEFCDFEVKLISEDTAEVIDKSLITVSFSNDNAALFDNKIKGINEGEVTISFSYLERELTTTSNLIITQTIEEVETSVEFNTTTCVNFMNAKKSTDKIYLLENGITDTINDVLITYSTNFGITGNKTYPNCFQIKKGCENVFALSSTKNITKVIITSLKDVSYDKEYAKLTANNNIESADTSTEDGGILTLLSTFTIPSDTKEVKFSNNSTRAMYPSKIEVFSK